MSGHWTKPRSLLQFLTVLLSHHAQEGVENMMSSLDNLTQTTDENVAALDALQDSVQGDTAVVQGLLVKGRAAQKVALSLLNMMSRRCSAGLDSGLVFMSCAGTCAGCGRATRQSQCGRGGDQGCSAAHWRKLGGSG